ncbi:MAG: DUF3025 domain-containing protein [Psychrobacter sp.]|nr:DUF3025 domain-containing protein [Psychrobacter sp.]
MGHNQPVNQVGDSLANNDLEVFVQVNWQAPWLKHLSCQQFMEQDNSLNGLSKQGNVRARLSTWLEALASQYLDKNDAQQTPFISGRGQSLTFVAQEDLPEGMAYETFIAETGNVPTRDNLHDLFNGSIWLTFPKSKALLNRYQAKAIDSEGISGRRGRVRDTITVFDENGAILVTANPNIGEALTNFDWQNCLVTPREEWDDGFLTQPYTPNPTAKAAVYIFGHALLEQLVAPRKPLCAHTLILAVESDFFTLSMTERMGYLDKRLSQKLDELLQDETVTPRALSPLPILGVPHFWPDNADPEFYNDTFVFRSGRRG